MGLKDIFWFGHGLWDPSHRFETSSFISPWLLFAIRLLIVRLPPLPFPGSALPPTAGLDMTD